MTWDGAPSVRTWDIWTHSYLILGLLEVHRHFREPRYLDAARRIGDLCSHTLAEGGIDITELGNHHGMSATVLMDPAVELYFATGDRVTSSWRNACWRRPTATAAGLLTRALAGADASEIATGKAYQLIWNLVGIAKLHRATGDPLSRGGRARVAQHPRPSPHARRRAVGRRRRIARAKCSIRPACSVRRAMSRPVRPWPGSNSTASCSRSPAMRAHTEEIERTAYNDLLGAQAPDGEDWCYYVFPNGRRVHTTYWRCCKSSGAMALEELPDWPTASAATALGVNCSAGRAALRAADAGRSRCAANRLSVRRRRSTLRVAPRAPRASRCACAFPPGRDGATLQVTATRRSTSRPAQFARRRARVARG